MGIGLFLANATIERFGGSVSLFNRAERRLLHARQAAGAAAAVLAQ